MLSDTLVRRVLTSGPALLALAVLLGGCNSTPLRAKVRTESLGGAGLERVQPADIALAPIQDLTKNVEAPIEEIRQSFHAELVDRLYSPLDLAFVDGHWSESSFRGATPPDATLVVSLTYFDASRLYADARVLFEADLRLFEGGSASGRLLWGSTVAREIDLLPTDERPPAPSPDLLPRAVRAFAREALAGLPERDPVAAHQP